MVQCVATLSQKGKGQGAKANFKIAWTTIEFAYVLKDEVLNPLFFDKN
ncbi:MAG: hypothetical protein IGQ45_15050 [Cyanobacterium sp. T60_A2020_053]|nr:hypothetical protein [Cyanobacterium sp. T60_A2020_053]